MIHVIWRIGPCHRCLPCSTCIGYCANSHYEWVYLRCSVSEVQPISQQQQQYSNCPYLSTPGRSRHTFPSLWLVLPQCTLCPPNMWKKQHKWWVCAGKCTTIRYIKSTVGHVCIMRVSSWVRTLKARMSCAKMRWQADQKTDFQDFGPRPFTSTPCSIIARISCVWLSHNLFTHINIQVHIYICIYMCIYIQCVYIYNAMWRERERTHVKQSEYT